MKFENLTDEQKTKVKELEISKIGEVPFDIDRDLEIENEKYRVIEYFKQKIGKTKTQTGYYYIIMCKDCGYIKKIGKSDFKKTITCKECDKQKHYKDFVGFKNIAYTVIDFDHVANKKLYYKCKCHNCGSEIIVRKDNILEATQKHCVKCKGNGIKPTIEAPINVYKYYYKEGAAKRGFIWELSDEDFREIISKPCHYCGESPKPLQSLTRYKNVKEELYVNGVDRIDSNLGYTKDNCVPCCTMCNRMKLDYNINDFITHVRKISNFYKSSTTIENTSK